MIEIGVQVASALDYAHKMKVVHPGYQAGEYHDYQR